MSAYSGNICQKGDRVLSTSSSYGHLTGRNSPNSVRMHFANYASRKIASWSAPTRGPFKRKGPRPETPQNSSITESKSRVTLSLCRLWKKREMHASTSTGMMRMPAGGGGVGPETGAAVFADRLGEKIPGAHWAQQVLFIGCRRKSATPDTDTMPPDENTRLDGVRRSTHRVQETGLIPSAAV